MSLKRLFILGFILLLVIAVPLTVYFSQQQQETRSQAARTTVLSFSPDSTSNTPLDQLVGDTFDLNIDIDPGENIVGNIFLEIQYDPEKLATSGAGLDIDTDVIGTIITEPQYTPGTIYVELTSGVDPTKRIQEPTTIGTITFEALEDTSSTPTQITFGSRTNAYVGGGGSEEEESYNLEGGTGEVLQSKTPAFIAIASNPSLTVSGTPSPTSSASNQAPLCSSLNVDRTPSGTSPFPITFTASGTDSDGTISKITYNFGDGPVEDQLNTGGIGTNSVSAQKSHVYQTPGTYTASAILTDNTGGVSTTATCTQVITVTQSTALQQSSQSQTTSQTTNIGGADTTTQTSTQTQSTAEAQAAAGSDQMAAPGPGIGVITAGIGAFLIAGIGALLFFSL